MAYNFKKYNLSFELIFLNNLKILQHASVIVYNLGAIKKNQKNLDFLQALNMIILLISFFMFFWEILQDTLPALLGVLIYLIQLQDMIYHHLIILIKYKVLNKRNL